ncbi:hypothetical protein QUF80_13885 [Desulfococcaceae bacterium HSG8]|nr:hypothetical protein [Desulfococcaceae bacterium HSG8]
MMIQREMRNADLARLLCRIDEAELAKALEPYIKNDEPRLLKIGKHRPFRPFRAVRMTGAGSSASEMVIRGRE